jgi:ParB-like chromosome segregation protein Spo0J
LSRINEEKLLASLYVNLKGAKNKSADWIEIATNSKKLSDYYGSPRELADKLGVSYELIRTILRLLKLPPEVRQLVKEGEILYDAAQRIERIRDPRRQIEVAKAAVGLTSHQTRDLIQYAKKYPNSNPAEYRNKIVHSVGRKERINVVVLPLRDETYVSLREYSKNRGVSVEKLVMQIISDWASNKAKN